MRQFYIEAMPDCGGLFVDRALNPGDFQKRTRAEMIFEIDVQSCLVDLGERVEALKDLKPEDLRMFQTELLKVGQAISAKKAQSLTEYETAAQRVTDTDVKTLPGDSYQVRMQEFLDRKMRGGVPDLKARREIAESMAREKVGSQYEAFISEKVRSLSKIRWSNQ